MKLNFAATVYNGIRVDKFDYLEKKDDYLAFLGRMSPEKSAGASNSGSEESQTSLNHGRQS